MGPALSRGMTVLGVRHPGESPIAISQLRLHYPAPKGPNESPKRSFGTPRAKPWITDAHQSPALKGRKGTAGLATRQIRQPKRYLFRPFRAHAEYRGATQGEALGYLMWPFQGRSLDEYPTQCHWARAGIHTAAGSCQCITQVLSLRARRPSSFPNEGPYAFSVL
jgi:hypothetical protein